MTNARLVYLDGRGPRHPGDRGGWRQHLILQRNAREGPTNVVRGPLDFSDSRSRMTVFASLQSTDRAGPFIQREIDITFIPGAVPRPDE